VLVAAVAHVEDSDPIVLRGVNKVRRAKLPLGEISYLGKFPDVRVGDPNKNVFLYAALG
jgi:hypothetical protein